MKLRYKLPFFNWLAQLFQKVSGIPPLTLPRAVAGGLKEVTAYGGCALNGIPSEYTEVTYVERPSGNTEQFIETSWKPNLAKGIVVQGRATYLGDTTNYRPILLGNYTGTRSSTLNIEFDGRTANNFRVYTLKANASTGSDLQVGPFALNDIVDFNLEITGATGTLAVIASANGTTVTGSGTAENIGEQTLYNMMLFKDHRDVTPTASRVPLRIYYLKVTEDGREVLDLVPVKRKSDAVVGFFDRVSKTFLFNSGTGNLVAGNAVTPSPDKPCEIWCNNGKLIPYLNAEGSSTQDGIPSPDNPVEIRNYTQGNMVLRGVGDYKDVYNSSTKTITRKMGVHVFTGEESFVVAGTYTIRTKIRDKLIYNTSYPTDCLCNYYPYGRTQETTVYWIYSQLYYFRTYPEEADLATFRTWVRDLYQNGTPLIVYFPLDTETTETWNDVVYTEGTQETITVGNSSAIAEILFEYIYNPREIINIDEQDILNGIITRKVGVKIFNGTENFTLSSQSDTRNIFLNRETRSVNATFSIPLLATHFVNIVDSTKVGYCYLNRQNITFTYYPNTTVNDFKQFLADQYNAGTPVIVVYPLATPVTEQVTPQVLDTVAGTNTLEITQASLPGLELAAEYKRH